MGGTGLGWPAKSRSGPPKRLKRSEQSENGPERGALAEKVGGWGVKGLDWEVKGQHAQERASLDENGVRDDWESSKILVRQPLIFGDKQANQTPPNPKNENPSGHLSADPTPQYVLPCVGCRFVLSRYITKPAKPGVQRVPGGQGN